MTTTTRKLRRRRFLGTLVTKHLPGRVAWMRPSDITSRYHRSGGWEFIESL